jgi:hypothetical protein
VAEAQEKTVFCSVSSPERVSADVQDVPEPPMVVASPSMVQTSPVTDSLIVMVSVIVSPLLAYALLLLLVVMAIVAVGFSVSTA